MLSAIAAGLAIGTAAGLLIVAGVWASVQWWTVLGLILGDDDDGDELDA